MDKSLLHKVMKKRDSRSICKGRPKLPITCINQSW